MSTATRSCPSCGAELPSRARFCRACGAPQEESSEARITAIEEKSPEPHPTLAGRSRFPIGRLVLVLGVVGVIAYFAISGGSGSPYKASVSGGFPKTQYVGAAENMVVAVANKGKKPIPDLTIELTNADAWVVQSPPNANALGNGIYSFGPVPPGGSLDARLTLVPKDAGNFTIDIGVYGATSNGVPVDSIDALSQDVAIVP